MKNAAKYLMVCGIAIFGIAAIAIGNTLFEKHKVSHLRSLIQRDDAAGVSELIEQDPQLLGVDLGGRHGDNLKALSLAAGLGKETICSNLIHLGANVNERDKYNYTPLHCAAMADNATVVILLLEQGGDPALRDFKGWTPLDLAREYNASSNLIARLVSESAKSKGR